MNWRPVKVDGEPYQFEVVALVRKRENIGLVKISHQKDGRKQIGVINNL